MYKVEIRTELKRAATSVAARIADEYAAADPENKATDSQRTHERRTNLISRAELLAVRTERVDISGIRYGRAVPSGPGATAVFHRFVDASLLAYNDTRDGARAVRRISAAEAGEDLEYIRAERARTDKIPHGEESERASPDKPHWPTRHHSDPAQSRARRRTGTVAMSFCGAAIATDQATEDWKDVDCDWCIRKKARLDAVDLTTLPLLYKRERAGGVTEAAWVVPSREDPTPLCCAKAATETTHARDCKQRWAEAHIIPGSTHAQADAARRRGEYVAVAYHLADCDLIDTPGANPSGRDN